MYVYEQEANTKHIGKKKKAYAELFDVEPSASNVEALRIKKALSG
jgi:hypothetical protein